MDEERNPSGNAVLIADAGSTKIDWAYLSEEGTRFFKSPGVNPYFHDSGRIHSLIKEGGLEVDPASVQRIHYYGAGCSSKGLKERVERALKELFPQARIEVEHDLLGAARASAGKEASLVAILGTGSNACSYDGERILDQSGGLGFILGDEGSGAHLGKLLLREYLDGGLSRELELAFRETFSDTREEIIDRIHRGDSPSRYLAGFATFLKEHEKHEWVANTLKGAFNEFLDRHILRLKTMKGETLYTVGSIGYHFRSFLEPLVWEKGMTMGRSVTDVIGRLVDFHKKEDDAFQGPF